MKLVDAVERRLHLTNPDNVHKRYPPGGCPWCPPMTNINRQARTIARRAIRQVTDPPEPS